MRVQNSKLILVFGLLSLLASCSSGGNKDKNVTKKDILAVKNKSNLRREASRLENFSYVVQQGSDDAVENITDGVVSFTDKPIALGNTTRSVVGLRFNGLKIPQGAKVISAKVQFSAHKTNPNAGTNNVTIELEDSSNSEAFSETAQNLSSRKNLSNYISWSTNGDWDRIENERGSNQLTPDLKALVQEIVNKEDWKSGNAISVFLKGDGLRNIHSYESSFESLEVNDLAATLVIKLATQQAFRPYSSNDDAEENIATGNVITNGSDLELGWEDSKEQSAQLVGIRFPKINITPNSIIHKAYIQFTQDEEKSFNPFSVTIQVEDTANASTFTDDNKNISSRTLISQSIVWSSDKKWTVLKEAGINQRTPDLTALVQELVNKPDWKLGNAISFVIKGKGTRTAEPFESGPEVSPKLVVEYKNASIPVVFDKIRLSWRDDPTSTMSIIWNQISGTTDGVVYYDEYTNDECLTDVDQYNQSQAIDRSNTERGMNNKIVRLTGLTPDTAYRFVIKNDQGTSECSWFRTAPNTPKAFSFISGGDTKSSGQALEVGRWSNKMVSKVRPLFVFFTGDFNSGLGLNDGDWKQWLTDWSTLTRSKDGRIYPIIAVHGNHENGDYKILYHLFDGDNPNPYYRTDNTQAWQRDISKFTYNTYSFGGKLLYLVNLNSETYKHLGTFDNEYTGYKIHKKQTEWFEQQLINQANAHQLKVVGYHKPMRPHTTSKSEGTRLSDGGDGAKSWADIFQEQNINVAYESDTHNHKFTYPIRRSTSSDVDSSGTKLPQVKEGFICDINNGVMYIGEGSWGASPRDANDTKTWTLDSAAINQFKLNRVYPAQNGNPAHIDINVIKIAEQKSNGQLINYVEGVREREESQTMGLPAGVTLYNTPNFGKTLSVPFKGQCP